ncbi:NAD-dependent epimerase/dehydratase family protein [Magnetospirillum fulvum]|uniref:UDP-glucose 4-epimerase n=1 Tax=Magnetospirillum fulvum TaxID=1082 RepID=A0A1H6H7G7_MAGFU|nr:NAD(P)-dependent oxidoreductase [Magnetospirillum fulvum]SEH30234.1 UDP-glucose 4-epimerase [Magnetospirillum fulvum]
MASSSSSQVLITGAAGFLGRHVAAYFARAGWQVLGIGNGRLSPDEQAEIGLARWLQSPIEAAALGTLFAEGGVPDVVVHAAGGASVRAAFEDPEADRRRTVGGTQSLLEALRRWAPAARLVLPSSAAVYGNDHPNPIPEDAQPAPISAYGRHKLEAEELCLAAARDHGQPLAIVRFFSLYGAGLRKQIFWDLWNKMAGGGRIVLGGTGDETRDFLHVWDAAQLLFHLADHAKAHRPTIVNGGTGHATTIRDAARQLERACACDTEIVFDGHSRPGDPVDLVAAIDRLAATGYRHRIHFADGLADYAVWAAREGQAASAAPGSLPA